MMDMFNTPKSMREPYNFKGKRITVQQEGLPDRVVEVLYSLVQPDGSEITTWKDVETGQEETRQVWFTVGGDPI